VTTVSNIDRNDPTGTKELSKEELEMKWKDLDQTISSYKEKAIEIFKTYTIL
jgi:hypothetical protein